jgi:hypothetical protein
MKKQRSFSLAVLSVVIILLYSSCSKGLPPDRLQREVEACPILWLDGRDTTLSGAAAEFGRYRVDYNRAGNPVDIIFTAGSYPGASDQYFRYDRYGRLSDYMFTYHGSVGSLIWHRYGYPDRHTITDTSFDYVGDVTSPEPPHASFDTYFAIDKLDDRGRIIKTTLYIGLDSSFVTTDPPEISTYVYDANGDMVRPGVVYDDKISPYQTNSVWMLIYNDYSVHNPLNITGGFGGAAAITRYNGLGLPLVMDGGLYNFYLFDSYVGDQLNITYGCGSGTSKGGSNW